MADINPVREHLINGKNFMLIILISLLLPFSAVTQEKTVKIEPVPSWVTTQDVHPSEFRSPADSQAGLIYYLVDEQYDVASQTSFQHYASQILNTAALQDQSNLTTTFAPSYQNLVFHYVWLLREGHKINLLERQQLNIMQREKSLEYNLYDGRLTAVLLLEDLRIGDILEYAYSYIGQNPIFRGKFLGSFQVQWSVPVKTAYYRLRVPKERKINIKYHSTEIKMEENTNREYINYVLQQENVPAPDVETDLPSWYNPYPWIQLSEYRSWNEVAAWAHSLFEIPSQRSDNLNSIIRDLQKSNQTPEKYVEAALRFVQDDIRYFGVEIGSNSHKPTAPEKVLRQRFGDCKDKSLLFCTLLSGAGIKADPVLLNTELRGGIDSLLPSPLDFDHVVVRIKVPSGEYFLDPTISYQRGILSLISFPWSGKALIVDSSSSGLIDLKSNCEETKGSETDEFYSINNFEQPVELSVITKHYGYDADIARAYYSGITAKQMKDVGYNYYVNEYHNLTITKPFSIKEDDEIKNILTLDEAYTIDSFWHQSSIINRLEGSFFATVFRNKLHQPTNIKRDMPFSINHPSRLTYRISATLPETWDVDNESKIIADSAFHFSYSVVWGNKNLNIEYKYRSKRSWVAQDHFPIYTKNVSDALNQVGYTLYYYPNEPGRMAWVFYATIGLGLIIGTFLIVKVARQPAKNKDELTNPENFQQQSQETTKFSREYQCSKCGSIVFQTDQICPHCNASLKDNINIIEIATPIMVSVPEESMQMKELNVKTTTYEGIRGWLIIPAIGLIVSLIRLPWETAKVVLPSFKQSSWDQITTPGLPTYHPMFGPVLIGELLANIGMIILTIITTIYFFRKMHQAPRFMIILLLTSIGILIIDDVIVNMIALTASNNDNSNKAEIIRILPFAIIWTLYFLRSRRVKATFIR